MIKNLGKGVSYIGVDDLDLVAPAASGGAGRPAARTLPTHLPPLLPGPETLPAGLQEEPGEL